MPRSVTCIALERGAKLQRISRNVFLQFVSRRPLSLQIYLEQAVSRLWRVSSFMVHDFLHLPRDSEGKGAAWDTVFGCGSGNSNFIILANSTTVICIMIIVGSFHICRTDLNIHTQSIHITLFDVNVCINRSLSSSSFAGIMREASSASSRYY